MSKKPICLSPKKLLYIFQNLRAVWKLRTVELNTQYLADVEAMLLEKHLVESDVPSSEFESSNSSESSDSEWTLPCSFLTRCKKFDC